MNANICHLRIDGGCNEVGGRVRRRDDIAHQLTSTP